MSIFDRENFISLEAVVDYCKRRPQSSFSVIIDCNKFTYEVRVNILYDTNCSILIFTIHYIFKPQLSTQSCRYFPCAVLNSFFLIFNRQTFDLTYFLFSQVKVGML